MSNSGKAIWLITGASLGAAIALLYAPQSGKETRRYLRLQAGDRIQDLSEKGRQAIRQGHDLYQHGIAMVEEAADRWDRGQVDFEGTELEDQDLAQSHDPA